MAELKIGSLTLSTSPGRDNFSALRRRYVQLGDKHRSQFNERYAAFQTADDLFASLPADINKVSSEVAAMVAQDLAANRIYDISEKSIRSELDARAEGAAEGFNRVQDAYFSILGMAKELDTQRKEAKNNRAQIVGGGFGVEGAATGIAQAAIANAAIGLVYGLANLTAKAASSLGDQQKKRQLLRDPDTKADVGDFLMQIALQGCELVAATVNDVSEKPQFDTVTGDSRDKSAAIVENVLAGRVPADEVQSVLLQALALNPFNDDAWIAWLDRFGDQDGSLIASADVAGITDMKAHRARLFSKRKTTLSWDTPEACRASSLTLEEYAHWLGLSFDEERALIEVRAEALDRRRRTFDGVTYPTEAEAIAARQAHDELLQRTVDGIVYKNVADADEVREKTRTRIVAGSRSTNFFGWSMLAYRRWSEIKGRSCRKEVFMFLFFVMASLFLATVGLTMMDVRSEVSAIVVSAFIFISAIVAIPLQIRRFHDQDRSGFFVLLNLIPYVGWLITFAFMFVEGTLGDNRFGPSPIKR